MDGWDRAGSRLAHVVDEQTARCLEVYRRDPKRVQEDANNERRIAESGYHTRQLEELLQNAVDASRHGGSRIEVLLTPRALYVANDGAPFDEEGLLSIMASDLSTKDDSKVGRFGIGFKSVLAVSDAPTVFSRSVSFSFDRAWAERKLRSHGFAAENYPVMRLARLADPVEAASDDPQLGELMGWASTVIALPLQGHAERLAQRLAMFPAEFALFSPHLTRISLRDETREPLHRTISTAQASDGSTILRVGERESSWIVVSSEYQPSPQALEDGGYSAARKTITVSYAVTAPPAKTNGQFWAYFPTGDPTTLSGIVNAPWKLSEDRLRVLAGEFNREILCDVVPGLVARAVGALQGRAEPAEVLDLLPARGRESRSWADGVLSDPESSPVFEHLRRVPSLPDGNGTLRVPSTLSWPGELGKDWGARWAAIERAPRERWVHHSLASSKERALKIRRLLHLRATAEETATTGNASIQDWLEALVEEGSTDASAAAIRLAATISRELESTEPPDLRSRAREALRKARIVRLEDGSFAAPRRGHVFVRVEGDDRADVTFVDPELAAMDEVKSDLQELGVVVMDRSGELHALLARVRAAEGPGDDGLWGRIWGVLRTIPLETALEILHKDLGEELAGTVRVRSAAGSWTTPAMAYLPGVIVPSDTRQDREFLIDLGYHHMDDELLRGIGATEAPHFRDGAPREPWLREYEVAVREHLFRKHGLRRPDAESIDMGVTRRPWPLQPLLSMTEEARVRATKHLIGVGLTGPWRPPGRTFSLVAPDAWFLRQHGLLSTAFGNLPPRKVLVADDDIDPQVLPAVEVSTNVARDLQLRTSVDEFSAQDWEALKAAADDWLGTDDDTRRWQFYAWLVGNIKPDTLVVRVGSRRQRVQLEHVGVTTDQSVFESMIEAQVPAMLVTHDEDYELFLDETQWGLKLGSELLQEELIAEPIGVPEYLVDLYPPIRPRLAALAPEAMDVRVQPCSRLERMLATPDGQKARPIDARRDGDVLMVTSSEPRARLRQAINALKLPLDERDIDAVFADMERSARNQLRAQLKRARDDDERLLAAVGLDALRRIVPAQALEALDAATGAVTDRDVAALARSVHGVGVLRALKPALEQAGLEPPREWTGQVTARRWVTELGFPVEWAGFPSRPRPSVEVIEGPVDLPELHAFQQVVKLRIQELLQGHGPDRGMVSLPTGAGKTRVTVQALVEAVKYGDIPLDRPVVWIAQSDELCEQAAQSWSEVWRGHGSAVPMRLVRLWTVNEVTEEPGAFQLVIATVDKLDSIAKRASDTYEWLREPSVVVIDEAHTSIAPSYTRVLDWLGRSLQRRDHGIRRPLLGLTATPFRGTSSDETQRLVTRYDNNRLDRGAFTLEDDTYRELQEMRVLAQVRHELIDGVDFRLDEAELAEIAKFRFGSRWLPRSAENRLGTLLDRTLSIADHIAIQPEDWTMLVFTPSVENARVLAALLSHRGVSAVSVSAETDSAARRHYVEEFKAGRIRVITNYNVLTQGFDAPKVQAVYVTRPTFSPNTYQQMVGRGLRGPANQGSDEVLIVNVNDNFVNFGEKLAFTDFEYLWRQK